MRNITEWQESLKDDLDTGLLNVELGLYLLESLLPNATAKSLWVLLTGYDYSFTEKQNWTQEQRQMLSIARHLLAQYASPKLWSDTLDRYQEYPEETRGYEITELGTFERRTNITVANNRFEVYERSLNTPVVLSQRKEVSWAREGQYKCEVEKRMDTVTITSELANFPRPPSHNLNNNSQRETLNIPWRDLHSTAEWMDEQRIEKGLNPIWINCFERMKLEVFNDSEELVEADYLRLDCIKHLGGIPSAGKSVLMKVLTVYAYRRGLKVTLIVADVLQIFDLIKTFTEVNINDVAPILGNSNKASHLSRLHKAVYNANPNEPYNQNHPGFKYLSSACLLTPYITPRLEKAFEIGKQPCFSLEPIESEESEEFTNNKYCPAYGVCPSHQKERDLVKASIWIATPGSLIYSKVPRTINRENIIYFELMARRSDLVIIDEVDQHQAYLDSAFSPNQTLRRPTRDAWIDELHDLVETKLKYTQSKLLHKDFIADWWDALQEARQIADTIYGLLTEENRINLGKWRSYKRYFTDWLLLNEVATLLTVRNKQEPQPEEINNRQWFMQYVFQPYINSKLEPDVKAEELDQRDKQLLLQLTLIANKKKKKLAIRKWINEVATIQLSKEEKNKVIATLEFALLVCTLQRNLYLVTSRWQFVRGILNLNMSDSMWFEFPPLDFNPLIPNMPMGNQLAFQYLKSYKEPLGSLQVFRCTGVGRWLFTNFANLFQGDNFKPPYLLMMSGTSWAGESSAFHVDVPVSGIISPREEKEIKIDSKFLPFYDDQQKPISVSGTGDKKDYNLKKIVSKLVEKNYLEEKLQQLNGRKILLLVNSYLQVDTVYEHLKDLGWEDRVIPLSRDDENINEWEDIKDKSLQRGQSKEFATGKEEILIAPLKSIERGHNIVNVDGKAAIGAAYFLVLPHPSPDDLSYAIHSINRWAIDNYKKVSGETLDELGDNFRKNAYAKWRHWLQLSIRLRTLPQDEQYSDRNAVYWDIIVCLWQVIGRLIRGNANAEVFWCDAKFAPNTAKNGDESDNVATSTLVGIAHLLHPYFQEDSDIPQQEKLIVQRLYKPFYKAIIQTKGVSGLPIVNI
ncbi:hypothetical protein cce_4311 [Crocosphaera subtropica ATCC 51142]|uniref:pPIWI-RE three-gene island domain-containing protein n=1 Tax=Crocosphaera subtropica (strain ATCC 51142 / BH68) TaxID=43989 RepID=B1WST0_CROS5|nr:hypothetical protein [Crocosphaera subtropica]ACB53659.1 hypothetical protein cce_4311 [Crocosphaera subtropica ATCC 51142]